MNRSGQITAITAQKRTRRRFNVFIDGEYGFSVSCNTAFTLRTGDNLSPDQIEALQAADQYDQAYERALHYLKYRPRSRAEVTRYLQEKGFEGDIVASTLERLEKLQYIDDKAFARFWIENRDRHRPRGAFALRFELKAKGVPEPVIEDLLSDYDETEPAWRAVSAKLYVWQRESEFDLKKKVYALLNRRGFTYNTCDMVFKRALNRLDRSKEMGK